MIGPHAQRTVAKGILRPLQADRQREAVYQVDYALVMLRRKIARVAGRRTQDEARALHARIAQLGAQLEAVRGECALYGAQIKAAEEDLGSSPERAMHPSCMQ